MARARALPKTSVAPGRYAHFLEAVADPLHEEHDDMLVWVGFKFDPAAFSVAAANGALQRVR